MLLLWDCFAVTKPLSQIQRSTLWPLQDANQTPSLGGFGFNGARAIYRAFGKQTGSTLGLAIRNYKANNGPRLRDDLAYDFTFQQNAVTVTKGDADAIPGTEKDAPLHRRIVTYLSNNGGPVHVNDLANTLNVTPGYTRTVLNRELKDKVQSLPDGRWGLSIS